MALPTLTTLQTNVRRRLDESTAAFWADADLTQWINEAARDIARRSETLQASTTINSVAGTQEYTLPTNALRIYRVEYRPDGATATQTIPLEYRDFNSMDSVWWSRQAVDRGTPYCFTMWGFPPTLTLVLFPLPATSVTAAIKVYYYRLPAAASSGSDTVDVPEGWFDLIEDYCEFSALRKDRDPRWQEARSLYEEKLQHFIETTRRWTDQNDSIQTAMGPLPAWVYGGWNDYF